MKPDAYNAIVYFTAEHMCATRLHSRKDAAALCHNKRTTTRGFSWWTNPCCPRCSPRWWKPRICCVPGGASTAAQAARLAGISRTAFYKYRDAVFSYDAGKSGGIVTVHLILQDNPGVLSALLAAFADAGANILTVNQNIPAGGVASVSISARTERLIMPVDGFVRTLGALPGVERITRLTGEGITGLRLDMPGA